MEMFNIGGIGLYSQLVIFPLKYSMNIPLSHHFCGYIIQPTCTPDGIIMYNPICGILQGI